MNSAETKIHKAFRKASQYCNDGLNPSEALSKSVIENELNPDMTKRAAEMLNIYLTHNFMRSSGDKTASFPLADVPAVLKKAFLNPMESNRGNERTTVVVRKKTASPNTQKEIEWAPKQEQAPREIADLVEQLNGSIKLAQVELSNLKSEREQVVNSAIDSYRDLVETFRQSHKLASFNTFESNIVSEYGEQVKPYLDNMAEILPNPPRMNAASTVKTATYFKRNKEHDLFDSFMDGIEKSKAVETKIAEASSALSEMNSQREKLFSSFRPISNKTASAADFLNSNKTASAHQLHGSAAHGAGRFFLKQLPGDPFGISSDSTSKVIDDLKAKGVAEQYSKQYAEPQASADSEMQNLRRSAILRDLITNDDIISGHDPASVQGAYNALLQLAPDATMNREVVRSFLRNAGAQQSIDPFTAKQVVDLQNEMNKQKTVAPSA